MPYMLASPVNVSVCAILCWIKQHQIALQLFTVTMIRFHCGWCIMLTWVILFPKFLQQSYTDQVVSRTDSIALYCPTSVSSLLCVLIQLMFYVEWIEFVNLIVPCRWTKCMSVKFNIIFHSTFCMYSTEHALSTYRTDSVVAKPYFAEPGCTIHVDMHFTITVLVRGQLKCDDTQTETKFHLSTKRTSPFKSAGGVSSVDYWQQRCAHQL